MTLFFAETGQEHDIGWCPCTVPSNSSLAERFGLKANGLTCLVWDEVPFRGWTTIPGSYGWSQLIPTCHYSESNDNLPLGIQVTKIVFAFSLKMLLRMVFLQWRCSAQATRNVKVAATLEPSAAVNLEYLALALKVSKLETTTQGSR